MLMSFEINSGPVAMSALESERGQTVGVNVQSERICSIYSR